MAYRLPPTLLPDLGPQLWIDDGRFTGQPVDGAESLPGRFVLPGLVDAHAHLSVDHTGHASLEIATANLRGARDQGVLAIRDVGAPKSITLDLRPAPDEPELFVAGRWHAPVDRFFPPFHDPVPPEALIDSALREVARGATWVKVVADWRDEQLSYEAALLRALVDRVHAAGARVAAHTQRAVVADVVAAGVDSVEHGTALDRETLEVMASRGVAWVPTLAAVNAPFPPDLPPDRRASIERARENVRAMLPVAHSMGIPILAGTDTFGSIADEVRWLVDYGLEPIDALRAASTQARTFLGLPSFAGGPADVVTFDDDPRDDPAALSRPNAIVRGGIRVR